MKVKVIGKKVRVMGQANAVGPPSIDGSLFSSRPSKGDASVVFYVTHQGDNTGPQGGV